jgi:hypothetical protein
MIGAPPTFYDQELEAQPQTQDYHEWAASYTDPQLALTSTSSYPHPTPDPQTESQAQPTPQHRDQYHFVTQALPSIPSDAAHYPYPSHFIDPSNSLSGAIPPQGWSQQSSVFSQSPASTNPYVYSTTYDPQTQHQSQPELGVPRLAVTPVSDTTLHSVSRISPASTNNALPSPGTVSSNTPARSFIPKRGSKPTPTKPMRKRQKSETDDDDDEDVLSASIDTSVPRPNPNRL